MFARRYLGPLAVQLSGWPPQMRALLLIGLVATFAAAGSLLYERLGSGTVLLGFIPVAVVGILLGARAGCRAALLVALVSLPLLASLSSWQEAVRAVSPITPFLVLVGLILGALRDLSLWIQHQSSELTHHLQEIDVELAERQRSELASSVRARQQSALASLGNAALERAELGMLLQDAIDSVMNILDVEYCAAWQSMDDGDTMVRVGGKAPPEHLLLEQLHHTVKTGEPSFVDAPLTGINVQIVGIERPFGALSACTMATRVFTPSDVQFVQNVANIVGTAIQRMWSETALAREASHDGLTGLPNRSQFLTRLVEALAEGTQTDEPVAVLFLDLDNFKLINDALGHTVGDQVLVSVASVLRQVIRPQDIAARLGGDEFTVLLRTPLDLDQATQMAQRLIDKMAAPLDLAGQEVTVTPSIGIAFSQAAGGSSQAQDLMRYADSAMYAAKTQGKARYAVFEEDLEADDLRAQAYAAIGGTSETNGKTMSPASLTPLAHSASSAAGNGLAK